MSNDYYIEQEDTTDWELVQQEFHEWSVLQDVSSLIKQKGYNYVLSNILHIVNDV